ncbi:MAG: hypothetical protein H6832_07130 [Planctomycetes bacterium]|nr:hypothetical protein [Planctomycetota bacterium]MCB9890343.1 hypothetical protein [Planctomycetota bacterium]MCB9918161.1 hypothetical protein [Planctomycetota bacterium]
MKRTRRRIGILTACTVLTACTTISIDKLEIGMRPEAVRARFGTPTQVALADRQEGAEQRKMLIEEYPGDPGHYLQLIYAIPLDIDELALQGDADFASSLAPELERGARVADLEPSKRLTIMLHCARLMRYRQFETRSEEAR